MARVPAFDRRSALLLAAGTLVMLRGSAKAESQLKVVASFSILADMVHQVAGDAADVASLVGRDQDIHAFVPTPDDARMVGEADLVVVNGLGLEGWLDRLISSSGYRGEVVPASNGVAPLSGRDTDKHDNFDPHAWQAPDNGLIYVDNITAALVRIDADRADLYRRRARVYKQRIAALGRLLAAQFASLPADRRVVVMSHDAFAYFGKAFGLTILAPIGVWDSAEPSARDVARLVREIRDKHVAAVFLENVSDPRLMETIAKETGARIGGTLYTDALSRPGGPAATYLDLLAHNGKTVLQGLAGGGT